MITSIAAGDEKKDGIAYDKGAALHQNRTKKTAQAAVGYTIQV